MPLSQQQHKNIARLIAGKLHHADIAKQLQGLFQAADIFELKPSKSLDSEPEFLNIFAGENINLELEDISEILVFIENGRDQTKYIELLATVIKRESYEIIVSHFIQKAVINNENLITLLSKESILNKLLRTKRRLTDNKVVIEIIRALIDSVASTVRAEFEKNIHLDPQKFIYPLEVTNKFYSSVVKFYKNIAQAKLPATVKIDCHALAKVAAKSPTDNSSLAFVGVYLFLNYIKGIATDYCDSDIFPQFENIPNLQILLSNTLQEVFFMTLSSITISQKWMISPQEVADSREGKDANFVEKKHQWQTWHTMVATNLAQHEKTIHELVSNATNGSFIHGEDSPFGVRKSKLYSHQEIKKLVKALLEAAEKPPEAVERSSEDIPVKPTLSNQSSSESLVSKDKFYDEKSSPLHFAIQNNQRETFLQLISSTDLDRPDEKSGQTPLMATIQHNRPEFTKVLLENRASVHPLNKDGLSALYMAVQEKQPTSVQLLLENGAKINERCGKDKKTPLMLACQTNQVDIVCIFLLHGADIHQESDEDTLKEKYLKYVGMLKIEQKKTASDYANSEIQRLLNCYDFFTKAIATNNTNIENFIEFDMQQAQKSAAAVIEKTLADKSIDEKVQFYIKKFFEQACFYDLELAKLLFEKHQSALEKKQQTISHIKIFQDIIKTHVANRNNEQTIGPLIPQDSYRSITSVLAQLELESEQYPLAKKSATAESTADVPCELTTAPILKPENEPSEQFVNIETLGYG